MMEVLVFWPGYGSVWLKDAEFQTVDDGEEFVVGDVGEGMDRFMLNFPKKAVRKIVGARSEETE